MPFICRKGKSNPLNSVKSMDINRALSQIRWVNLFIALACLVLKVIGLLSLLTSFNIFRLLVGGFSILFLGILLLYELQMKKLSKKLRVQYGFLYTYIGRALYVMLYVLLQMVTPSVGTVCLSSGDLWGFIGGIALFVIGVYELLHSFKSRYNLLIFFFHPAFRQGNRKITDDPTVSYTSGESVIIKYRFHVIGDWQRSEEQPRSCSEGSGWCFEAFAVDLFVFHCSDCIKETRIEASTRYVSRNVRSSKALRRHSHLAFQHLDTVNKPVQPDRDSQANNAANNASPLLANNNCNNADDIKNKNNQSPDFVLHFIHRTRANACDIIIIPRVDDSLSSNGESEEDQTDNGACFDHNLDNRADTDAASITEHLLHILCNPTNNYCREEPTQQVEVGDNQADTEAGAEDNRAEAEDNRAGAGDNQAEAEAGDNQVQDSFGLQR